MLLISTGVGATTPDYPDSDGDLATGPVGIRGISADSGSNTFTFDLYVDNFEFGSGRVEYTWQFTVGTTRYDWSCEGSRTFNGPSIFCDLMRYGGGPDYETDTLVDDLREGLFAPGEPQVNLPEDQTQIRLAATHHLNVQDGTVGFTASYDDLGLAKGDSIMLVGGEAHFIVPDPAWASSPADAMAVGESVSLK